MEGDERVRFCALCRKQVYNIAAMTSAEAEALIQELGENLCALLYRRADGTVLTADCPVGVKVAVLRRLRRLAACAAMLVGGVFSAGSSARAATSGRGSLPPLPTGSVLMSQTWIDWALEALGFRPQPQRAFLGKVVRPPAGGPLGNQK